MLVISLISTCPNLVASARNVVAHLIRMRENNVRRLELPNQLFKAKT